MRVRVSPAPPPLFADVLNLESMISVTDLKKGAIFVEEGAPFLVLDYKHIKMARGKATIRVKVKNLKTGAILEKTFTSGSSVEEGEVVRRKAQFLYSDETSLYFMDPESFEQFSTPVKIAEDVVGYLKEGEQVTLMFFEEEPVGLDIPLKVALRVEKAAPGERGDTKQGGTKEAVLETGIKIQVPMFVERGDVVRVNTQTGEYADRVS